MAKKKGGRAGQSRVAQTQPEPAASAGRVRGAPKRRAVIPTQIAEQIRELIVRGVLSPGVHLGQMQLAEQFHVSRVPVREALKLLAAEGILLHDPNRGFFVAPLSSDEAKQLYRIRHLIEIELLSTVEWPSASKLAELQAKVDTLERLLKEGNRAEWSVRHREFHRAIFNLSSQKILVREALRLWTLADRYRSLLPAPGGMEGGRGTTDELDLLKAIANRDRKRLLSVFELDRSKVEQRLLSLLGSRGL